MAKEPGETQKSTLKTMQASSDCCFCDSAIFDLDLPSVEKLTFIALTSYYNGADRAMPSNESLARDVGCSEERIALAMERLKEHVEFVPEPVIKRNITQQ